MVVASAASGNVTKAIGDDTQTTITGRLAVYYPMDHSAGYSLIDSVGEIELIPGPGGAGNLYRYAGATIEVTGNLVSQDGRRILYVEKWLPAEVSVEWAQPTTVTGPQTVLMILAQFPDIAGARAPWYFQSVINGRPSMNTYFVEDSYSMITVRGNPTSSWYTLPNPSTDYNVHTWESCSAEHASEYYRLAEDAFRLADPYVNYAAYNHFIIVTARDYVWGCSVLSGMHDINTNEGTVRSYSFVNENSRLTAYLHEFSHDLGLPDLYDYSNADPYGFIDGWDLMSQDNAQHHSAWSKMQLGWIPESQVADFDLTSGGFMELTVTIDRTERPTNGYHALRIRGGGTTFYLVETRQKIGFDVNLPSDAPDHGVLITYCLPDLDTGMGIVREVDQNPTTQQKSDGDALWQVGQVYSQFNKDGIGWAVAIQGWTGTGFVITVSTRPLYPVLFTQTGLPSGVGPTVQYQIDGGPVTSGTAPFIVWVEGLSVYGGAGHSISYSYQDAVTPSTPSGAIPEWYVLSTVFPLSPQTVISPLTVYGTYVRHYTVTFEERGLPYRTTWGVTVGGTRYTADNYRLLVYGLVGTVNYQYDSPVSGLGGSYVCASNLGSPCSGSVSDPLTLTAIYTYRPIIIANLPPRISSLTVDRASPQKVGSTITWTCIASDPENDPIQYKFQVQVVGQKSWVTVQDWSKSNVYIWNPPSAGLYNVRCLVRDGNHAPISGYDDSRTVYLYRIR
jgi:M6 family metalloprotease-like protein